MYLSIYLSQFVPICYCSHVDASDPNYYGTSSDRDEVRPEKGKVMLVAQKQLLGFS